ncbi:hypothetical protein A3K71_05620 [archaeon RBG_16_50_20]|nr:MAG: hypothetical protein A3K71_05620 [archaeon RBG_16_50_20]
MASRESVSVPLLAELIPGGVKPGAMLLVEFDPESQWFAVATTLVARYFQQNRHVCYLAMARSPEDVKRCVSEIGVDIPAAEKSGRLVVEDWYSATLTGGRLETANAQGGMFEPIQGGLRVRSLKVADLSVEWLKTTKVGPQAYDIVDHWPVGSMIVVESFSGILRFNEEKPFVEWMESRVNPEERKRKSITLQGFVRGIHSDWLYKRMESASDGVIDIRVMERGEETKNLLRVRSLKGQPHDSRWHEIEIKSNGEANLVESKADERAKLRFDQN